MNISVVIPNYNGVHLFPETLPCLYQALKYCGKQFEIIIIDDCSTDDSVVYLKKNYSDIQLYKNEKNSGFSITINKGIFTAQYELVFLLNSDVRLSENYFVNQFKYFDLPDTFGVMGKIIGWDNEQVQDGAKYPEFHGFKLKTSKNCLPNPSKSSGLMPSLYLSGANALVNREKLLQLRGFNELFSPFYIEDLDLSVRAWRGGYKCYFDPRSICRHKTSESIKSKEKKIFIRTIYNRNKLYFHAIHLNGLNLAGWAVQTLFELLIRLISFRTDYLNSCIALLRNLKAVKTARADFDLVCKTTNIKLSLGTVQRNIVKALNDSKIMR